MTIIDRQGAKSIHCRHCLTIYVGAMAAQIIALRMIIATKIDIAMTSFSWQDSLAFLSSPRMKNLMGALLWKK
jgi:hypothetical protein